MVQKQRIRYCAIVLHCADRLQCRACELTQDSLFGGFGGYLVIARPVSEAFEDGLACRVASRPV